jgi:cyclase
MLSGKFKENDETKYFSQGKGAGVMKRIIPCLDVKEGRVVKGVGFLNLKDAGDPVELARYYDQTGADELVFLDIAASSEGRQTMLETAKKIAQEINIPFIVGGGINSLEQIRNILGAGAEKVSLGTAALENPALIAETAQTFGSRHLVVAVDVLWDERMANWQVYSHGGRKATGLSVLSWVKKAEKLGAGEILLTSMDADGAGDGFNIPLTAAVAETIAIPVIASGGAGEMEHFARVLTEGKAQAALAASVFHYGHIPIQKLKKYLRKQGVEVLLS